MKRLEKKHPLAIRWFHWLNFPILMVMIWSGLVIYWANDVYHLGPIHLFPDWLYHPGYDEAKDTGHALYSLNSRLAEGMAWHFLFMWFFALNGILYVLYTAFSGEWRYLLPDRHSFREAIQVTLHDLHLSKYHPPRRKFNGAQRIAYSSMIVMGLGSLLTGLAIYKPTQFAWLTGLLGGYPIARFIHFWLTMGYCAFFVVHIIQVIRAGWNQFRAMITGFEVTEDGENVPGFKAVPVEEAG